MRQTIRMTLFLLVALASASSARAQSCTYPSWCTPGSSSTTPKGKISRNFYRTPYEGGVSFFITSATGDYIGHGGSMDTRGAPANTALVAMADGVVCSFNDSRNDCGCDGAYGSCGNCITIVHDNGEMSRYLHLRQGSITAAGMFVGRQVYAGEIVGMEGDVGRTCGNDGPPRAGTCIAEVPAGAGNCFRHNHWNVIRIATGEPLMPMTCEIPGSVYTETSYVGSGDCSTTPCVASFSASGQNLSGLGTWRVWQADTTVTLSTVAVSSSAAVVAHAGERVRLTPGFHASPGGYFRAEIGTCNTTAIAP